MAGCGVAHGYPVSSRAVAFDPHPSDQLYSGGPFPAETDSGVDAVKPSNRRNVDSSRVQHGDGDDASAVINAGDEVKPENSKSKKSTYPHPLPLLVKQTQRETVEGLSFPTVQYFKQFVESMKNSFLTPGNDPSRYFQTARQVMENEFTSNALDPATDDRPNWSGENSDRNKTWSESMNSVENEDDVRFQQPSVPDSAPSTEGSSFHETQRSYLNTLARLAADRAVYKGDGGLGAGDLPTGLQTAAGAQNRNTRPGGLRLREQMPSGSLFGEPAPAEALSSPADGADPDLDPKISEGMSQESDSEDSSQYENPSGGSQLGGLQKKDPREKIPADVLYSPKASPHVAHINNGSVSGGVPKERESLPSSSQTHQSPPTGEEESKGLDRPIGSSASSHDNLSPWGRRGQAADQLTSPNVLEYEAYGSRQPPGSQHAERNPIFGVNEPKQMSDDVQAVGSGGSDSAGWVYSPYGSHFLTQPARPSASDAVFWSKIGPKENSRMKNRISDDPNLPRSFFTPQKKGVTLKGGSKSGLFQRRRGAKKGHFYQTGVGLSLPFYATKTTGNYFRSKVSFLKTHYAPH